MAEETAGNKDSTAEGADSRPEAIIAEIYRQLKEIQGRGEAADSVVMTMEQYRQVQRYHATLGETPAPAFDYISKYEILGLGVLIDNGRELTVFLSDTDPGSKPG